MKGIQSKAPSISPKQREPKAKKQALLVSQKPEQVFGTNITVVTETTQAQEKKGVNKREKKQKDKENAKGASIKKPEDKLLPMKRSRRSTAPFEAAL